MRYDEDANGLLADCQADMDELRQKLEAAQATLPTVKIDRDMKIKISTVCSELDIDGLRGDLVVNRAACALVAYEGRDKVRVASHKVQHSENCNDEVALPTVCTFAVSRHGH